MPLLAEELAEELGVKPSFWKLLLTEPNLAIQTQLGPVLPILYRIHGPQSLPNAGELYTQAVARTRAVPIPHHAEKSRRGHVLIIVAMSFVLLAVIVGLILR